jgi:hypothetical protein
VENSILNPLRYLPLLLICLFAYQNCDPVENTDSPTERSFEADTLAIGSVDMQKTLHFKMDRQEMTMDWMSGEMNDSGQCLKAEKLNELRSLFSQAGVCQKNMEYSDDILCAQVYTEPYAEVYLEDEGELTALGEKHSACPESEIELCFENQRVQSIISDLKMDTDFESCP